MNQLLSDSVKLVNLVDNVPIIMRNFTIPTHPVTMFDMSIQEHFKIVISND